MKLESTIETPHLSDELSITEDQYGRIMDEITSDKSSYDIGYSFETENLLVNVEHFDCRSNQISIRDKFTIGGVLMSVDEFSNLE